jgi:hypothetical protein
MNNIEITKRFSIRHGMESEPSEPVFDDAPRRLRFFVLETLQQSFYPHVARQLVARVFCKHDLLVGTMPDATLWKTVQRHLDECAWPEIYNLIEAMYSELKLSGLSQAILFEKQVNQVFAEESIGWKLDEDGLLQRTLPAAVHVQMEQIFAEMEAPRFAAALVHLRSAYEAYNARPRSDLDVCSKIFDALESVAKEVFSLPSGTFGDVLKKAKTTFSHETISTLEKLYALANNHFRHGRTTPFALSMAETDFVYVTCLAGMMLFVRCQP